MMILNTDLDTYNTLKSGAHNKMASIRVAIMRAINKKQGATNNRDVWQVLKTTQQMSKLWRKLKAENVIFAVVGNGNDAFHAKGKEGIDPDSSPTGASEQILSLIERYDQDTNVILKRMYNYVKKVMDMSLFENQKHSSNKNILEVYFDSSLTNSCGFQDMYDMLFESIFRVKTSTIKEYTTDHIYYKNLFYTNFTDGIAIGTLLPSVLKTIPSFMDNIISYKEINCDAEYAENVRKNAEDYADKFMDRISERNNKGIEEAKDATKGDNTYSNIGLGHSMPHTWEPNLTLRAERNRAEGDFDTKRPRHMKSRDFVLEFAVVIGSRRPSNCPTDNNSGGSGGGPGGDPGGGQGGDPKGPRGGDPGGGQGGDPKGPRGGDPGGGQGGDPKGPRGGDQNDGILNEKIERLIDKIGDLVPNIVGTGVEETTGVVKELIKQILREIGETDDGDIDSEATAIRGSLISEVINSGSETGSDKSIIERRAEESNRVKEKLRKIIQGKIKNKEGKTQKEGGDHIEREWIDEVDEHDPSLFQDVLMDAFDKAMVEYLSEGGKAGGREWLLVEAAFELSGLSSGVLDLVYRLLAQHVHDSVFKNRGFTSDSVFRETPDQEVLTIDSIYKRPALIAILTQATGVIPSATEVTELTYRNTPTIVSDYLSIDVSGSLHGIIQKALKAHESIQTDDGDNIKLSDNPVFSNLTEYIVKYLASKIYSYINRPQEMDEETRKAMQTIITFINDFRNEKFRLRGSSEFYKEAAGMMKSMADSFNKIFYILLRDMKSAVVDSPDKGNITIAKLLNHISSVLYMGIYANPLSFLSAKREGSTLSKNIVSVLHDGEVPSSDDYQYPFTITSIDNYVDNTPIFPSLTKSIDVNKGPSLEQLIKHIRRHARNLHGGNAPAPDVGAFWARTLIKDVILSAAGYYRNGIESASMKIAFNVLHLTDCEYSTTSGSLEGHVAGFVDYLMNERYMSGSYPAYKQIIDGLIRGKSVHDVVSGNNIGIDSNTKQALLEIKDNISISTMIFEKNGVGLLVNIFGTKEDKNKVLSYVYYIDFVDLVVYQFEDTYSSPAARAMFAADTRNLLSKTKFSQMFDNIMERYGVSKDDTASSKNQSLDDETKKLMFVQSVASMMPRSVKYYTMNTAAVAVIYMFYSTLALALIGSNLLSLGNLGEQREGDEYRITVDTSELRSLKSRIASISAELDNNFTNNIIIKGIFWDILNKHITAKQVNMQFGKLLDSDSIDAYSAMQKLRAAAQAWLKKNPKVSIEDIVSYLEGRVPGSEAEKSGHRRGFGLYGFTDADANDNPMGGIIPIIPIT
jgi:hypothetical protein